MKCTSYNLQKFSKNIFDKTPLCSNNLAQNKYIFDPTNNESLNWYINSRLSVVQKCNNTTKYMMMLYGPPACGKSRGVSYGIKMIDDMCHEKLVRDNFLEINLDNIIGDIIEHKKFIDQQMMLLNNIQIEQEKNAIIESIKKSYLETRKKHENISEIMIEKCVVKDMNFTLESTGSNFGEWYFDLFQKLKDKKYKIVLVYPRVTDEELLIKRAYERGLKMGRFITKEDYHNNKYIEKAENNFKNIIQHDELFDIILEYNSE
jgi:hypothetical protein